MPPPPGFQLTEATEGAAHVLVRKAVASVAGIPPEAVLFIEPLRVALRAMVRKARGSDLLKAEVLRQLTAWPDPELRPALNIVLVDEDEDAQREQGLVQWRAEAVSPTEIGVSVREFEAWLLGDSGALAAAGVASLQPAAWEKHARGVAKTALTTALRAFNDAAEVRVAVARQINIATLRRAAPSFDRFCERLTTTVAEL